jgi:hypothetical protein
MSRDTSRSRPSTESVTALRRPSSPSCPSPHIPPALLQLQRLQSQAGSHQHPPPWRLHPAPPHPLSLRPVARPGPTAPRLPRREGGVLGGRRARRRRATGAARRRGPPARRPTGGVGGPGRRRGRGVWRGCGATGPGAGPGPRPAATRRASGVRRRRGRGRGGRRRRGP